jgi:hypothetical protein
MELGTSQKLTQPAGSEVIRVLASERDTGRAPGTQSERFRPRPTLQAHSSQQVPRSTSLVVGCNLDYQLGCRYRLLVFREGAYASDSVTLEQHTNYLQSTLPGWGYLLALCFTFVFTLFFGAQMGITGFQYNIQPICQMLAGYLFPGHPLANFYFTCFTYNTTQQAELLAKDLRLAQQNHIPPRITFILQIVGCLVGGIFSEYRIVVIPNVILSLTVTQDWVMMISLVQNQGEILRSVQGSNIWSGQNIQQFNTLAIAWSIASKMFSVGSRYEWVTLAFLVGFLIPIPAYIAYRLTGNRKWGYINPSIILWYMGNLFVGINSSLPMFFIVAFISQFYIRKYHPSLFVKYNYLVSAAMDGGTQVMVFILTFAVAGGSGKAHPFPTWAGNPDLTVHNADYCMVNPANNG